MRGIKWIYDETPAESGMKSSLILLIILAICLCFSVGCIDSNETSPPESIPGPSIIDIEDIAASSSGYSLEDSTGREISIPRNISRVLCSGDGCMRYLSYLQATDKAIRIDRVEHDLKETYLVPYLFADPSLQTLPVIDLPLTPAQVQNMHDKPDVIILMNHTGIFGPEELEKATGIPVLLLQEGDLTEGRDKMDYTLRVMGLILNQSERAEEVIRFFDKVIENLKSRTSTLPEFKHKLGYIGGIPHSGDSSLLSTDTRYVPFGLTAVLNSADNLQNKGYLVGSTLLKQGARKLSPDAVFIDLTSIHEKKNPLSELETMSEFVEMPAVREGAVYGLLPSGVFGRDHEVDLINAYAIGKILYPEKFTDVDPEVMADYILAFFYNRPLFAEMNRESNNMAFTRIPLFS